MRGTMQLRSKFSFTLMPLLFALWILSPLKGSPQCAGIASTPRSAADCAAHAVPLDKKAVLDPGHPYTLAELIDIAERNNPRTRVGWELAKQRADSLGVAKSAYYPVLSGLAIFADQRFYAPFPRALESQGGNMIESPLVQPEVTLEYLLFDFGKREAKVDAATAEKLAGGANFIQANQEVAFLVASGYYKLLTAQE